jgi:Ice-binding-like
MSDPVRVAASLFCLVSLLSCPSGCSSGSDEGLTPRFELINHTASALNVATVAGITGTYGGGCEGRAAAGTDSWTVSLSGGPAADELSVRTNDVDCLLTLEAIITSGGTYIGTPSIALEASDTYSPSASAFAISGQALAFHGNAKISALTFATDFRISLLVSDEPRASDAGLKRAGQPGEIPDLRSAATFAVMAGSAVTNSGATTTIFGNLGVSPGTTVTGVPGGQPSGTLHLGTDVIAVQAQNDMTTLYQDLASRLCPAANLLTGQDLAGMTLRPGIYCFASSAELGAGTLVLDANHDPDAYWVIQIGSALDVGASSVSVINGGTPCNVFWQVGSSATLLDDARFLGNLVALTSITLNTGATVSPGRVLARGGAVTMLTNQVSMAACQ